MRVLYGLLPLWMNFAWAKQASQTSSAETMSMLPMTLLFVALFYTLIIRPQNQQKKAQSSLIEGLKKDDEVALSSGIIGIITKVDGDVLHIKIAKNTQVQVLKQKVQKVLPKHTFNEGS